MTVVNPKSISGINSITMASGSDNLLTIHANDTSEKVRVNSSGDVIVGSGVTLSPDGDAFFTGVCTATTFKGDGSQLSNVTSTTINNNADNRLITGSGTANTLEAEANITSDGNDLTVNRADGSNRGFVVTHGGTEVARLSNHGTGAEGKLELKNSGTTKISLNGVSGTMQLHGTAGYILFGDTDTAAHQLDDYEEGTYTPTFSSSGATFVYNHQYGYYQKVGDHVHVTFYITLSGTNSSGLSGNAITINLPFSASGSSTRFEAGVSYGMIYKIDLVGYGNPMGTVYQGNSYISVLGARDDNTGVAYSSDQFDASGCGISGSVTYKV